MFYDLNIIHKDESTSLSLIEMSIKLGYSGIAFNNIISSSKKLSTSDMCNIPKYDYSKYVPSYPSIGKTYTRKLNFEQYSRISIIIDDSLQVNTLSSINPIIKSYDIFAVEPISEKAFSTACLTLDVDIITLDLSSRLPFQLKRPLINAAVSRGIKFELKYNTFYRDPIARRNMIANIGSLIRFTKEDQILLSSNACNKMDLRSPLDAINLLSLFDFKKKDVMIEVPRQIIVHGITRKTIKGAINIKRKESELDKENIKKEEITNSNKKGKFNK